MNSSATAPRVGVEIEYSGLTIDQSAELVSKHLGGIVTPVSPHEVTVSSEHGDYRIEVDFALLKELSRESTQEPGNQPLKQLAVDVLAKAAGLLTPIELVTPPLPEDQLPDLSELVNALGAAGAVGTGDSIAYAFGVHFNPEVELDSELIVDYLKAFCCLDSWLRNKDQTDLARRISGFMESFPLEYEKQLLQPAYLPDMTDLTADYLAENATRNRALDLLPLLAQWDADSVQAAVNDPRVNPRPTFHYRLPNSQIGRENWSVLDPWRGWTQLRALVETPHMLRELCRERLEFLGKPALTRWDDSWIETCQQTLDQL